MPRQRMLLSPPCFLLMVVLALGAVASAQRYRITDVGPLGGSQGTGAEAINSRGAVAGSSSTSNGVGDAIIFFKGKDFYLNVPLDGSIGLAINASNQVAGYGGTSSGYNAFLASRKEVTLLPTLGGDVGVAYALNDQGDVVGWSSTPLGFEDAFLYHNGTITDLGTLGGSGITIAYGINNAGQIVGSSWDTAGSYKAFLWENGTMVELKNPKGINQEANSQARGINQKGEITGRVYTGFVDHAFIYRNGKMIDIDPQHNKFLSVGLAINNKGTIVGYTQSYPFVWNGKKLLDLNKLIPRNTGWSLWHATGINDRGQISGDGTLNNQSRGFLLTPVK
jgi:probable HAF family extracellular repeat protein